MQSNEAEAVTIQDELTDPFQWAVEIRDGVFMDIDRTKRIYRKELLVPFSDVDYLERMKTSAILREFSEIAGDDYSQRGMTHRFLEEHGGVFLVSRIACNILGYPTYDQRINILTWEAERRGPQFIRAYNMTDEDGNLLAEAESGWLCIEVATRKITRPRDFPWPCPVIEREMNIHISKIKVAEGALASEHAVAFSDMDANGHLYNATYGDLITNALTREEYDRGVREISINYAREAKYGDLIQIFREDGADEILLTGKIEDAVCFESKLKLRPV